MDEVSPQSTHESASPLPVSTRSRLYQITPLSKYLAMALFIAMPFLGGYVGYHTAQSNQILNSAVPAVITVVATSTKNLAKEHSVVIDNARLTVDLRPTIQAELMFTVTAQDLPTVDVLNEMLVFRPESGVIVLEKYHSGEIDEELLRVAKFTTGEDLETILERMTLEVIAETSNRTVAEAEREQAAFIISRASSSPIKTDVTFSSLCELGTRTLEDKTIYDLNYTGEFGTINWPRPCGSGGFQIFDGVVVANFATPTDAMEPKTIPFDDVRLIKK